ncbi:hypothetical protein B0H14DRAFT_2578308 [Mycena olivaceomarginata]|nr:hypothetical protein B0H14DRAFT_2578308 [Mycena olivaceomarginata]
MSRTSCAQKPSSKTPLPKKDGITQDLKPLRPPMASMQTSNAKAQLSIVDRAAEHKLYKSIEILDWTLHEKYNVPQCRDRYQCKKCKSYFLHLIDAIKWGGTDCGEDEDDPMDSSSENGSKPKAKG